MSSVPASSNAWTSCCRQLSAPYATKTAPVGLLALLLPALGGAVGGYCAPQPLDTRALMMELRTTTPPLPPALAIAAGGPADSAGAVIIGEQRSVALALSWNHELRAFRLRRGVAEGEVISAAALANPELRSDLTHIQRGALSQMGWDVRLSWEPPRPGVRGGRRGAAAARLEEVDKQVSEREWALTCDVRAAYARLVSVDEEILVARDTVANRRWLGEVVARRLELGGATRLDIDLVQLSLVGAEQTEAEVRLNLGKVKETGVEDQTEELSSYSFP